MSIISNPNSIAPQQNALDVPRLPVEGSQAIRVLLDFTTTDTQANGIDVDLTLLIQNQRISSIKTLFLDNADGLQDLIAVMSVTNQRVVCPPRTQMYVPILAAKGGMKIHFTNTDNTHIIPVLLLNKYIDAASWGTFDASSVTIVGTVTTSEIATLGTSNSSTITVGGTAQIAIASNPARHEWWIINSDPTLSTESLWVSITGTATNNNTGGDSFEVPYGAWASGMTTNAISVIGATTGHKYTAGQR